MKKHLLFMLAFLPMVLFTSCSSDEDGTKKSNELSYIQLQFHFTPFKSSDYANKKIYAKEVYLFYLEGKKVKEPINPYATTVTKYGNVCVINDVNGEYIFADYSGDYVQLKDTNGYYTFDCLASAIYNYNLYGKQSLKRGNHLLVIKADGTYFCKKININPNGDYAKYDFNLTQTGSGGVADKLVWF